MDDKVIDRIERLGKGQLRQISQAALKRRITWAKQVPYYKKRLSRISVKDAVKDISKVPLLSKTDLLRSMGNRRFPSACWSRVSDLNFIALSGGPGAEATSGPMIKIPLRAVDMKRRGSACARILKMAGDIKGRSILLQEISHSLVHQAMVRGCIQAGATAVQLGRGFTLRHVRHTLPRLSPTQMLTYPSYAQFLKELLDKEGKELKLKRAFLWGEIGGSIRAMRKRISKAFSCSVFDIYAMQEFGVLGGECKTHDGLHGMEDLFLYEIIDPLTEEVLPDGRSGELVVTDLSPNAMPLIRYRTGDITSIVRGRCRCGRTHLRLKGIRGRVGQSLIGPDGDVLYAADIAEKIWANPHLTGAFKMIQGQGVVIETKRHKEMSRYYLEKLARPKVRVTFERLVPRFHHRTEYFESPRYHSLLKEQMRLEM